MWPSYLASTAQIIPSLIFKVFFVGLQDFLPFFILNTGIKCQHEPTCESLSLRIVNLPQLEVEFFGWVWILTATSPYDYLFIQISGGKFGLVAVRKSPLVFVFGARGCKKMSPSRNSKLNRETLPLNWGIQNPLHSSILRLLHISLVCCRECTACGRSTLPRRITSFWRWISWTCRAMQPGGTLCSTANVRNIT